MFFNDLNWKVHSLELLNHLFNNLRAAFFVTINESELSTKKPSKLMG